MYNVVRAYCYLVVVSSVCLFLGGGSRVVLPYCDEDSVFNGSWTFHDIHHTGNRAFSSCPKTLSYVSNHHFLYEHIKKYSCANSTFRSARYNPTTCRLIKLVQSTHILSEKNVFITLVGDSLMGQLYIALLCTAEQYYFPAHHIQLVSDLYLRPDIPCSYQCITNKTYRREAGDGLLANPCLACKLGTKNEFDKFSDSDGRSWPAQIPPQTTVLVLGSGAWYHNSLTNPDKLYVEMLSGIGRYLHQLIAEGMTVYWHDLPPMDMYQKIEPEKFHFFGWNVWNKYNEYARNILSPFGVKMLTTSATLNVRKVTDPAIASDYVHWCNPGRYTIPQFITAILFNLIAVDNAPPNPNITHVF